MFQSVLAHADNAYLGLRDVHHADADVRASLCDHGHGRPAHVPGTHAADLVLELIGRHGHDVG